MDIIVKKREEEKRLFLSEIGRVGMAKFSEIFYGIVEKQEYMVNPEEFFSGDPNFDEIYMKLQKEFYLSLFRAFLPHSKPEKFAERLSCLGEHDLPKNQLLKELDSTPPPLEEMKPLEKQLCSACKDVGAQIVQSSRTNASFCYVDVVPNTFDPTRHEQTK